MRKLWRRIKQFPITEAGDRVEAQTLEDLVDLSLHEINNPVGQINPSWSNSENEQTDEDLSIDWPEERDSQNHPKSFEPKTSKSES